MDILETVKTAMMFACGNKLGTLHLRKFDGKMKLTRLKINLPIF